MPAYGPDTPLEHEPTFSSQNLESLPENVKSQSQESESKSHFMEFSYTFGFAVAHDETQMDVQEMMSGQEPKCQS